MSNNINLTRELAIKMIRSQEVVCPKCNKGILVSRYTYKNHSHDCRKTSNKIKIGYDL